MTLEVSHYFAAVHIHNKNTIVIKSYSQHATETQQGRYIQLKANECYSISSYISTTELI